MVFMELRNPNCPMMSIPSFLELAGGVHGVVCSHFLTLVSGVVAQHRHSSTSDLAAIKAPSSRPSYGELAKTSGHVAPAAFFQAGGSFLSWATLFVQFDHHNRGHPLGLQLQVTLLLLLSSEPGVPFCPGRHYSCNLTTISPP